MKKYITWERVVIVVLLILLIGNAFVGKQVVRENIALKLENQQLDSIKNKLGQTVLQQESVVISTEEERDALKQYSDSLFQLTNKQGKKIKDILAFYQSNTTTSVKDRLVPYKDTSGRKKWEDSVASMCKDVIKYYEDSTIKVPRKAVDTANLYYKASFTVEKAGVKIDSISIPNTQYVRFVVTKGGFLKRDIYGKRHLFLGKRIEAQVINTNPLVTVYGQQSAIYQAPKKLRLGEKALLIAAGIYLGTKL